MEGKNEEEPLRIAVVGAGGLGVAACWGLLAAASDFRRLELLIIDHDQIELSNLNRQILYTPGDIGLLKCEVLRTRLLENPAMLGVESVEITSVSVRLELSNIEKLLHSVSCVLDCCDHTETKFLINDYCVSHTLPFCYGGVVGSRAMMLWYPGGKRRGLGCLRCLFGDFGQEDYLRQTASCRQAGIIGAVAGHLGFMQADAAIDFLNNRGSTHSSSELMRFSFPGTELLRNVVVPSPECPNGCGLNPRHLLDIRDRRCPATFLYTKVTLEGLGNGDILDVRLSTTDSVDNVSRSVQEMGHYLRGRPMQISGDHWRILVEKGGPDGEFPRRTAS